MKKFALLILTMIMLSACASGPVLGAPTLLQQALNALPAVSIAGQSLQFQFGGETWIAKLNGANFSGGTIKQIETNDGFLLALKQTHMSPSAIPGATAVPGVNWIEMAGSDIVFEYKAGPPMAFRVLSKEESAERLGADFLADEGGVATKKGGKAKKDVATKMGDDLGNIQVKIANNWAYGLGRLSDKRLFNGHRIVSGETYTLKMTYTASRDLEGDIYVGLIDTAGNPWRPLSWPGGNLKEIPQAAIPKSKAGEKVSATIVLTTLKAASKKDKEANALCFITKEDKTAVTTLNFSEFVLFPGTPEQMAVAASAVPVAVSNTSSGTVAPAANVPSESSNSNMLKLDAAIARAARDVEGALPRGTMIALFNFASPSRTFSDYVLEELTGELVKGGKVAFVDRRNQALLVQETKAQVSGNVSDDSLQSMGRILGAKSVVSGTLTSMGNYYRFRIRVMNVETQAIQTQISLDLQNDSQVTHLLGSR